MGELVSINSAIYYSNIKEFVLKQTFLAIIVYLGDEDTAIENGIDAMIYHKKKTLLLKNT